MVLLVCSGVAIGFTGFGFVFFHLYTSQILASISTLAQLSRQPLEAEAMTEFIRRSMEIVAMAAEL